MWSTPWRGAWDRELPYRMSRKTEERPPAGHSSEGIYGYFGLLRIVLICSAGISGLRAQRALVFGKRHTAKVLASRSSPRPFPKHSSGLVVSGARGAHGTDPKHWEHPSEWRPGSGTARRTTSGWPQRQRGYGFNGCERMQLIAPQRGRPPHTTSLDDQFGNGTP